MRKIVLPTTYLVIFSLKSRFLKSSSLLISILQRKRKKRKWVFKNNSRWTWFFCLWVAFQAICEYQLPNDMARKETLLQLVQPSTNPKFQLSYDKEGTEKLRGFGNQRDIYWEPLSPCDNQFQGIICCRN